jgi:hypothetical protein
MDRISAHSQVSLSLLRSNSLKFQPQCDIVTIERDRTKFNIPLTGIEGARAYRQIDATINLSVMSWQFRSPEWGRRYFTSPW